MWVRSPLEVVKYLFKVIFPFLRSGVETKRGDEPLNTQGPETIGRKAGERNVLTLGSLCLPC